MEKLIIEIPKIEDWKKVNELAKQVHKLHVKWRPDLFLDVEEVIIKDYFKEKIQSEEILVVKQSDDIIGYVVFSIIEKENPIMRYRKVLSIEAICIDEKNRGKGIGTKLLEKVKDIAKKKECTDLYLSVNEENKSAIKVYEKFGFKVKSISYSMRI